MKKLIIPFVLMAVVILNGCKDKCYSIEQQLVVVKDYMSAEKVLNSFQVQDAKTLVKPGNIYAYKNLLLVCEQEKGIHIMNNANPSNPISLKYINLLGNENIAIKEDILYADNGSNLLSIDISDLDNISIVHTNENIFPERREGDKLVVGYHSEERTVKLPCNASRTNIVTNNEQMISPAEATGVTGKGASMARFAAVDDFLYIARHDKLTPFNISNPKRPEMKLNIGFRRNDVETLFPYGNNLFFGATSGVYVYNFKNNPEIPTFVSEMNHVVGCDPVVVQGDFAFSTVRGGSLCRNGNSFSSLFVFDISTITQPRNVTQTTQESPFGLGIKEQTLFVCNGTKGLFVYDWDENTQRVELRNSFPDIHAFDVIVNGNTLIVTADNGLFQFDISNPLTPKYLSTLVEFK